MAGGASDDLKKIKDQWRPLVNDAKRYFRDQDPNRGPVVKTRITYGIIREAVSTVPFYGNTS